MNAYDDALERVVAAARLVPRLPVRREFRCPCGAVVARIVAAPGGEDLFVGLRLDADSTRRWVGLARVARLTGGRAPKKITDRAALYHALPGHPGCPPLDAWCPKHGNRPLTQ